MAFSAASRRWAVERPPLTFAAAVAADESIPLPPAVALDVGVIPGRGWAVVEPNAAWGSGIYGCDPAQVLRVVRRACVQREHVNERDARWIIRRQ